MKYERPYIAEEDINVGRAVAAGSADNTAVQGADDNDFIGVYEYESQRIAKAEGEHFSCVISGPAKVEAGASVTRGSKAVVDADGRFINCPTDAGEYDTVGTFLESADVNEFVDMMVERGSVTITA